MAFARCGSVALTRCSLARSLGSARAVHGGGCSEVERLDELVDGVAGAAGVAGAVVCRVQRALTR